MKFNKAVLFIVAFCASFSVAWATPVDVTSFGAVGDSNSPNPTDNRIPIQNAIDSLPTTGPNPGGTVYFPPGNYNVSGTLYVPSNVRLQGIGSYYYSCQLRLTAMGVPLFEVADGKSNITFKDLTLVGWSQPRWPRYDTSLIRMEGTTGISFKSASGTESGISNIVIENVRISQFTQGISATSSIPGYDASISNVKIRNYASDGNEYSLYTNTRGADGWDVQNMNVFPMYDKQNGLFLELSGQMSFL